MLQSLISSLKAQTSNDADKSLRRHPRREDDQCVVVINGKTFPVENWSVGGLLIQGDERFFGVQQDVDFTIKFKLRNSLLEVNHNGRVVRKTNGRIALEFLPVTQTINKKFQQVVDDYVAGQFASSQIQ